jgi:hypothetical protein
MFNKNKMIQIKIEDKINNKCKKFNYSLKEKFNYKNNRTKLFLICNNDNYGINNKWNPTYKDFIKDTYRCPKCSNHVKITQEEAEEKVKKRCQEINCSLKKSFIINNNVSKTKLYLICNIDNYEWTPTYKNFINKKSGCPKCAGNAKITQKEADIKISNKCKNLNYILTKDFIYNNSNSKISLLCNIDNYKWNPTYNDFINNNSNCPKCAGNIKITQKEAEEKVEKRCQEISCSLKNTFIINGSNKTKLFLICSKHNYGSNAEWNLTYNNFINNKNGCPICKQSKGELEVRKYLEEKYKKLYVSQKTFKDCKDKSLLKFDFFIEKYKIAIEYQGIQHYKETYYTKNDIEGIKRRDNIKKEYCKNNNIFLIEIPYTIKLKEVSNYLNINIEILKNNTNKYECGSK